MHIFFDDRWVDYREPIDLAGTSWHVLAHGDRVMLISNVKWVKVLSPMNMFFYKPKIHPQ